MPDEQYIQSIADWRAMREARLLAEDRWLNLVGLWWLDDGPVTVGSAADRDAELPRGPASIGMASLNGTNFKFELSDESAKAIEFIIGAKAPTRFTIGSFLLEAVMLAGRPALRARDVDLDTRSGFDGIEQFDVDPKWRIVADWVPLANPIETSVDTVIGAPSDVTITHKAIFAHDGQKYELLPTHGTATAPQFVLRDATSGKETYPASRFLFGEEIGKDTIVLDFNKAINPPCAFTQYAVCPLPPPENVMPFRIEAGEKWWKG